MESEQVNWRVLLIGGCSGVGKTWVARQLGKSLQLPHLLVDDIRLALQAVTSADQLPALHYFLTGQEPAQLSPRDFVDGLIGVGTALAPALQSIIEHHVTIANAGPLILEGDSILPAFVEQLWVHSAYGAPVSEPHHLVKCVFLDEPDEEALLHNFLQRDRGFNVAADAVQRAYIRSVWEYGRWLAATATQAGLPLVSSRPFDTVIERVLGVINDVK